MPSPCTYGDPTFNSRILEAVVADVLGGTEDDGGPSLEEWFDAQTLSDYTNCATDPPMATVHTRESDIKSWTELSENFPDLVRYPESLVETLLDTEHECGHFYDAPDSFQISVTAMFTDRCKCQACDPDFQARSLSRALLGPLPESGDDAEWMEQAYTPDAELFVNEPTDDPIPTTDCKRPIQPTWSVDVYSKQVDSDWGLSDSTNVTVRSASSSLLPAGRGGIFFMCPRPEGIERVCLQVGAKIRSGTPNSGTITNLPGGTGYGTEWSDDGYETQWSDGPYSLPSGLSD
uniref:32 kDa protein n=1 Tax=Maize chlorotic mottle virus TaxID=12138 RepID=D1MF36_MCMV|nr:32 kDa protein [Maize chlorotic mottle virus]